MEGKVFVKLTLLVEVREQLRKVCAIAEMRPARVVSALVLAAARLLSYGFSWFDLILYINVSPSAVLALVEIAQDEAYPPDVAVWLLTNAAAGAVRRGMEFGVSSREKALRSIIRRSTGSTHSSLYRNQSKP